MTEQSIPVVEGDFFSVIGTQRAMRRLKPDPVPEGHIKKIIWAATRAPSGGNRQPWRFLVVTDAAKRAKLAEIYSSVWEQYRASGYGGSAGKELSPEDAASNERALRSSQYLADHLAEVPVLIIPCVFSAGGVNQGVAAGSSIYPAIQNLMLAARALGLGTALTTLHRQREDDVRELLGIPGTVDTAALIPVGWPKGKFGEGRRQPVEAVTYWDSWGAKRG
jgi:nitroreductase